MLSFAGCWGRWVFRVRWGLRALVLWLRWPSFGAAGGPGLHLPESLWGVVDVDCLIPLCGLGVVLLKVGPFVCVEHVRQKLFFVAWVGVRGLFALAS